MPPPKKIQKQSKISNFFNSKPSENVKEKPIEVEEDLPDKDYMDVWQKSPGTTPKSAKRSATKDNCEDIWQTPKENSPETTPKSVKHFAARNSYEDILQTSNENSSEITPRSIKRKRVIIFSDDEEDNDTENNVLTLKSNNLQKASTPSFRPSSSLIASGTPKSSQRVAGQISSSFINSFRYDENDSVTGSNAPTPSKTPKKTPSTKQVEDEGEGVMLHLTFDFLKPDKVKDAKGRLANHPDYDSCTLYVPPDFLKKATPGHQQWWQFKSQFFDTVLFFKVGKFYEMYHMDAVTGVDNLKLTYMRGKYAHCGFPEVAFGGFADTLIRKGYKVARIEQTETPAQLEERNAQAKVKDKVVRRELCQITTQATQTYSTFSNLFDKENVNTGESESNYLLSICEKKYAEDGPTKTRFGVSFVDCTIGQFYLCEFVDDNSYSTLRTLLAHNQPTQVLLPRNGVSKFTKAVINSVLGAVSTEELKKKDEFWAASETLKMLLNDDYLGSRVAEWPKELSNLVADLDEPIPKPNSDSELSLSALGAIVWYLKKCLVDVDLITMRKFEIYTPATISKTLQSLPNANRWFNRRMVLDGFALNSLHLLPPKDLLSRTRADVDIEGNNFSLFNTIDHCITPFGRRLLRQWICAPTCDSNILKQRQESILFLCKPEAKDLLEFASDSLKRIPDLERLFQRIHTLGSNYRRTKHPDNRAQIFDAARYNSQKVRDLCVTLSGLEQLQKLIEFYCKNNQKQGDCPPLITECIGSKFENLAIDLKYFKELIPNRDKVLKEGIIKPKKGMGDEYDKFLEEVDNAEKEIEAYLTEQKKIFKSQNINYFGSGKNRYQLEIPEALTKKLSDNYELKSQRKGYKRYSTPELDQLIQNLSDKEKQRDDLIDDSTRRVFAEFDHRKDKWSQIVNYMAIFDCLMSLARYSSESSLNMCVPEFDFQSQEPYLEICQGYHPSCNNIFTSSEYIPNDTMLGRKSAPVLLLTGANMGGKSTLMRQTAVLVVLAQIGSLVPAKSMRLTPVDRVFSRIGASDCLAASQSTFYVELNETNTILKESSQHSLVIIDELGRGTSTFDGTAIAAAVLKNLAEKVKCRTLFSTHYHSLCSKFAENSNIALGHMSCLVENDDFNGDPSMDDLTFLYTLASGPSPKSYGFFTARMAGINSEIIRRAYQYSKFIDSSNKEHAS